MNSSPENYEGKTRRDLIREIESLRQRIADLDKSGAEYRREERESRARTDKLDAELKIKFRELKATEEPLRRLAAVVRDSNDAIILFNMDGNILAWNRGAERMYGYSEGEALKMNALSIVPEDERGRDLDMMSRLRRGETIQSFQTKRVAKDGRILHVWLTITVLRDEGLPHVISTTERDITDILRKEEDLRTSNEELLAAEEELRVNVDELSASQENLRKTIEMLNAVLVITASAFTTLELDKLLCVILNALVQVMRADAAVILLHEGDRERFYAGVGVESKRNRTETIPIGEGFAGSIAARKEPLYIEDVRHGALVYSDVVNNLGVRSLLGVPMVNNRDIVGVIHVDWLDVHPFSEMEQQILMASAERCSMAITNSRLYMQTLELKRQAELYLDIMGHDINNLNQSVLTNLELIREEANLTGDERESIEQSIIATESSARIISNVRRLQKIDEEKIVHETMDINDLILECVKEIPRPQDKKITINYTPRKGLLVICVPLLKEVFCNLINNSIKHSGQEVTIDIGIGKTMVLSKKYYTVSISDNGPGISDVVKPKLFNRFERGTTKAHGKGLGLYIVKSILEKCDGSVKVEDRVPGDYSKGAKFTVSIPAKEGEKNGKV